MRFLSNNEKITIFFDDLEEYEKKEIIRIVKSSIKSFLYKDWE